MSKAKRKLLMHWLLLFFSFRHKIVNNQSCDVWKIIMIINVISSFINVNISPAKTCKYQKLDQSCDNSIASFIVEGIGIN